MEAEVCTTSENCGFHLNRDLVADTPSASHQLTNLTGDLVSLLTECFLYLLAILDERVILRLKWKLELLPQIKTAVSIQSKV